MARLFGVDVAREVGRATRRQLLRIKLIKVTATTRTPTNLAGGRNPTRRPYTCDGIVEDYDEKQIDGTLVKVGDRQFLLIADSLPSSVRPAQSDEIEHQGVTYSLMRVRSDPAEATFTCQGRKK